MPNEQIVIDEAWFRAILAELVDSNSLACRAVLSIARLRFTDQVPTLAVTLTRPVELLVNLDFVRAHCRTEEHVAAVIMHEFLHVLLGHTEQFDRMNPALNVALDAVINGIIHRSFGKEYSSMMSALYGEAKGVIRLLRPMTPKEQAWYHANPLIDWRDQVTAEYTLNEAWNQLYAGRLCADDILDLIEALTDDALDACFEAVFLGNHDPRPAETDRALADALNETMRQMNGHGIWRSPRDHGIGGNPYETLIRARDERMELWEATAWTALRRVLLPNRAGSPRGSRESEVRLPVLSPHDRRGFLRAMWSPLIPETRWPHRVPGERSSAFVYLDVSGSMEAEMGAIIALLGRLRRWISSPFWAFSDEVCPAEIEDGALRTSTSGGTSIHAVLRHIAKKRPERALIVTDGYVGQVDWGLVEATAGCRMHALVTRDGSTAALDAVRIPCTQLDPFPSGASSSAASARPRPTVRFIHGATP